MKPLVGVVMGSENDWPIMSEAVKTLDAFGVSSEARVVSAHRTPHLLYVYANEAESRGLKVIVAGAGGAAHLPGMLAAITVPLVLGVPMPTPLANGMDSLLSIVQMPRGVAVGALAVGKAGASNAGLLAVQILGIRHPKLLEAVRQFKDQMAAENSSIHFPPNLSLMEG